MTELENFLPTQYETTGTLPINHNYLTEQFADRDEILAKIREVVVRGDFTLGRAVDEFEEQYAQLTQTKHAIGVGSGTDALFLSLKAIGVKDGDEVITTPYTFYATIGAIVTAGARPVFVDVQDDYNIDPDRIEAAITPKTRAIVPVHYAGVACEMDVIMDIASRHGLLVIEDAAQGILSTYKGRPLGSIGHMAALSFHETKNIISGEGGALLVNDARFVERAEIIREKGTNRSQFFRGQVDKYTWVDIGSSYLPGEILAAFLWAQMEEADGITKRRLDIWANYHQWFVALEKAGKVRRPVIPRDCRHNAHMYYLLLPDLAARTEFIARLKKKDINTVFHYVPLHASPMGRKIARACGSMQQTEMLSERLVRLPLWVGLEEQLPFVTAEVINAIG